MVLPPQLSPARMRSSRRAVVQVADVILKRRRLGFSSSGDGVTAPLGDLFISQVLSVPSPPLSHHRSAATTARRHLPSFHFTRDIICGTMPPVFLCGTSGQGPGIARCPHLTCTLSPKPQLVALGS